MDSTDHQTQQQRRPPQTHTQVTQPQSHQQQQQQQHPQQPQHLPQPQHIQPAPHQMTQPTHIAHHPHGPQVQQPSYSQQSSMHQYAFSPYTRGTYPPPYSNVTSYAYIPQPPPFTTRYPQTGAWYPPVNPSYPIQHNAPNQTVTDGNVQKAPAEKRKLTFYDPTTKKPIDLVEKEEDEKATSSSTKTTPTLNSVPTSANSTNKPSPPSVSNILLQKVSEEGLVNKNVESSAKTEAQSAHATTSKTAASSTNANTAVTKTSSNTDSAVAAPALVTRNKVQKPNDQDKISDAKLEPHKETSKTKNATESLPEAIAKTVDGPTEPANEVAVVGEKERSSKKTDSDDSVDKNDLKHDDEIVESSIPKNVESNDVNGSSGDKTVVCEEVASKENGNDSNKVDEGGPIADLHYEPWQYNPKKNRDGKRVYSKKFLLDVCEKICKLKIMDPIAQQMSETVDFTPTFLQAFNPNRPNDITSRNNQRADYGGRRSDGRERPQRIIPPSSSLTQEVELKPAEKPWRPNIQSKETSKDAPSDVVEIEDLKKKFRSILNKLTPNNFDNLAQNVTNLNIDTEQKLGHLIDIIFAKALSEPGYCVLYGQMCSHLKKTAPGNMSFSNTLLKRCQYQFQSDIYEGINLEERRKKIEEETDPEVKKHLDEELYEDMYRCRMRGLGLIKFIGVLYKIEMLIDKIMLECINRLLEDPSEESLECLCDLLSTIGEKLDKSCQKNANAKEEKKTQKPAQKPNAYQGGQRTAAAVVASGAPNSQQHTQKELFMTLDPVFEQLHKIRKNKDLPISLRIRFKLLDVCELREKFNWQSKNTKDNNPKKLDEIREAHMEKLELEKRQNAMGFRRSQEGRRGLVHTSGSSGQISSMAGEPGRGGQPHLHSSASSHSIRDHSASDNMKSSHNDLESQKNHQAYTKKALASIGLSNMSQSASKPQIDNLRPMSNLRPMRK